MQQLIRFAALALAALLATLAATPAAAQEQAEGQSKADYLAWLSRDPGARAEVLSFKAFLEAGDVEDVVPTWQLVRTASAWRECAGPRFEVAPVAEWAHISATLKFVKAEVEPVIGKLQAVSGFRNEELNHCAGGAPASAHAHFYALDLVPLDASLSRGTLIRDVCDIHQNAGRRFDIGLGFYTGRRFHLDSKGFRRWGANGSGATSPCATGNYA
jgi:Peptidase M15